jgi:A/G-specific adenine glycosylase
MSVALKLDPASAWDVLGGWYARHKRDLPWRHTRDPYAILVSEVMLQQTQVDRVIPKYHAFLASFPTLADLAAAPTDTVIRVWSGLGYNQRAVRLQQIARAVRDQHAGTFPETLAELLKLPGIGRYTAGALACFALGQAVAMVDTNIRRVLTRIFLGELGPEAAATQSADAALALAEAVLPPDPDSAYQWNQALMDLGATICVARAPACERCPLTALCQTYAQMQAYTLFPSGAVLHQLQTRLIAESPSSYATKQVKKSEMPFKTSSRYYRGRVVAALRELAAGESLALSDLGPLVKEGYAEDDRLWLIGMVEGLIRDGLAIWADEAQTQVSLPR